MIHYRFVFICFFLIIYSGAMAQPGQITVPRVEMMPNQPSPYNVRDWKEVAMKYDSFLYDLNKTGQYLPLSYTIAAGYNYPQNPMFGLHTYVGTNSPLGNEGINVLPSLVGATLVGIDKSAQFGKNWVLMSQDFFNKNNGEHIYLNAPATSSGNDWWYDMMPNVYFYQLYDLYPGIGGDAEYQFTTVADRFLEAVRAMGGNEAPWSPAFMNYRAWKFKTMEPNTTSVPEPEAAGAFAWVLYNAWKETGNPDYLKGAEWSIEFLDNWSTNPSYELQLPYGTLTAARMNAEIGTDYDVEKMLNWSFDKGPLRGWGTIVGTWGGFAVSGLIGEANDAGNDYAFQMNGEQQAAALVPMVRYDKRFARAIGKWMLNLANANRLFYHGFLPASNQDASAWSAVHDPDQVIGYEAMREVWQGYSPFSTGDAVGGGWAATNLALYGTSSVGYLGAVVEKTNVSKILKLDLLATDFFRDEAYPTYLFFNSYGTPQSVQFDVGGDLSDVYDALSETFILEGVTGTVSLIIPGNEALLVTVTPAGGEKTYDRNKMLVDGVVVDFMQSAQPFTWPPRIKGLGAVDNPVEIGQTTAVYATVSDPDSEEFTYEWSASAGTIEGSGDSVLFTAPLTAGDFEIQCIVSDPEGNSDTAAFLLSVVPEINDAPQIEEIQKSPLYVGPGETMQLTCVATDADFDPLTYDWAATGGSISGSGSTVQWTAPSTEGIYQVSVIVSDDQGLSDNATVRLLVKVFSSAAGNLIAYYPFSGNADDASGNELHGQVNGAILTDDPFGHPQSAYFFFGSVQNITVENDPVLNFQDGITVTCWFNADALPEKETFLLSHGSWQSRWKISVTPDRYLRWTVKTLDGIADVDGTHALQTDSFYHLAATYDDGLLALYLNGDLHNYQDLSGKIRTTVFPFLMAQMLPADANYNFKGVLDEVRIYDYAMTPDSVKALYEKELTPVKEVFSPVENVILLSPNPAKETLVVTLTGSPGRLGSVQVFDLAGRLVMEEKNVREQTIELNLKNCKPGIYVVYCKSPEGLFSNRFVKIF